MRLRRAGFRVEAAGDASVAAALLAGGRFDVTVGNRDVQERLRDCATGAFAVIGTPLDFEALVHVVRTHSARRRDPVDLSALQRFVASIPTLRDALAAPMTTPHELVLRGEIRRTILELSGALEAAAEEEPNRTRAAVFLAASAAAADLAASARSSSGPTGH